MGKKLFAKLFLFKGRSITVFNHRKITPFITTFALSALLLFSGCRADGKAAIDTTDGVTNILDYVSVDFNGKNGEGTAFVNVDYDGIETEMVGGEEKIKELSDVEDLAELTKYINAVSSISFTIDKNKELSNGDQVIVTVTYDSSAAEAAGVVFGEQKNKIYVVKGLKH
jgi:hypothetical protein